MLRQREVLDVAAEDCCGREKNSGRVRKQYSRLSDGRNMVRKL